MSDVWSLFTYLMVQPNLVRGFLLSRRERNIRVKENRDSTAFQRRHSGARTILRCGHCNWYPDASTAASIWGADACWSGVAHAPRNISFTDESWNPTKSRQVVVVEKFKTTVSSSELQNITHVRPQSNTFNPLYFPCLGKCRALIYFSPLMFLMAVAFSD